MDEQMTKDNQVPVNITEEIETMLALGGLSPAQRATFTRAAQHIREQAKVIEEIRTAQRWNPGRQDAGGLWIPHFNRAGDDGMWIKTADVKRALTKLEKII